LLENRFVMEDAAWWEIGGWTHVFELKIDRSVLLFFTDTPTTDQMIMYLASLSRTTTPILRKGKLRSLHASLTNTQKK